MCMCISCRMLFRVGKLEFEAEMDIVTEIGGIASASTTHPKTPQT